jgi:hypothetical protein
LKQEAMMEPNRPLSSPIHITTIEEVIRIVFKENDLTRDRRNEEAVEGLLREHGYAVESGNQVGGTAYHSMPAAPGRGLKTANRANRGPR